jgi:serine/threonine protein kinase
MAPEIMQGKNYDKSSDIYSFGIIVWELMTNEIPHHQKLTV